MINPIHPGFRIFLSIFLILLTGFGEADGAQILPRNSVKSTSGKDFILLSRNITAAAMAEMQTDSLKKIQIEEFIARFGPIEIFETSAVQDSFVIRNLWKDTHAAAPFDKGFSTKTVYFSKIKEKIWQNHFYGKRSVNNKICLPLNLMEPIFPEIHLLQFVGIDSFPSTGFKIFHNKKFVNNELDFYFNPLLFENISAAEYLLLEYFLVQFFKTNLVQNNSRFIIPYAPIEVLCQIEMPEYLPFFALKTNHTYAGQLIREWPRIQRVLLDQIQVRSLEKARQELQDHLLFNLSSAVQKISFITKLALTTGRVTFPQTVQLELRKMDLKLLAPKFEKIISQGFLNIDWFTAVNLEENSIQNFGQNITFEIINE